MTALSSTLAPMTMAGLIEIVLADPDLSEARRRNVASSIRRFCAALDTPPDQAPATFWFFRERMERFHPRQVAFKPHRWQTIRSDVAFALRHIGLAPDQPKPRQRLSAAWTTLRDCMRDDGSPWRLSRFTRFCDARQVQPAAVDDAAMDAYLAFVRTQTFKANPEQHHRDVCSLWNRLAERAPGLRPVTIPAYRTVYTPTWEALPVTLQAEAEAWLAAMSAEGDLLDEAGPIRPHRPASIRSYRYAIRQLVAGLQHSGRSLATIDALAVLVEPDAATAALQFHLDRNGGQPSQMLAKMANVLMLIAQHAVGADPAAMATLRRYRARLAPKRAGLSPRPRKALRQFVDRSNIEKLLVLPHRIHARLLRKPKLNLADARQMQVAVALELLLMRPIRRANLVALRLGEHVLRIGGRTVIVLGEAEVKNGVAHDYPLPVESARLLDFYVDRLLPLFGDNPARFLFPGEVSGKPKSGEQFGRGFSKTIRAETGLEVYPHLLRHFAATLYLTEHPEGIEVVRRVLGHRSAETTQRSYAGVQDQVAVRRFDELLLGIRGAILKEIGHG